jgi:hypothetical protein
MQYSVESGTRVLTVGKQGRLAITELVPTGVENGPPARLTAKFNPATAAGLSDGQITMCKAETGSYLEAFGLGALLLGGLIGWRHPLHCADERPQLSWSCCWRSRQRPG